VGIDNNKNHGRKLDYWLVVSNMNFIFDFIYGMSSFPLTFIFFRGVGQPPTSYNIFNIAAENCPFTDDFPS
jgi:hypothetical protein